MTFWPMVSVVDRIGRPPGGPLSQDLFEHEERILAEAREGAETGNVALVKEYAKLLKTVRRLVRINDRNEEALRGANRKVQEVLDELRQAQAELVETEKLAALGGLVAGVAHEVNTPVGVIVTGASALSGSARQLQAEFDQGNAKKSTVRRFLERVSETAMLIEKNATRAAGLIESFKTIAVDRTSGSRRRFDLAEYVADVCASLSPETDRTPHQLAISGEPGIVCDGFPGALSQVVTNLLINALRHGFPDGRAGRIEIAVGREGDDAWLRCTDNGVGIGADMRARIFEPFYTTARDRGGSGLGLYVVRNIVTSTLGGRIEVSALPGGGTQFDVTFPLVVPENPDNEGKPET